jgi:Ca2+-binding EF-hand superfamily protein
LFTRKDRNGRITIKELRKILQNAETVSDLELEELIKEVDVD